MKKVLCDVCNKTCLNDHRTTKYDLDGFHFDENGETLTGDQEYCIRDCGTVPYAKRVSLSITIDSNVIDLCEEHKCAILLAAAKQLEVYANERLQFIAQERKAGRM